MSFKAVLYLVDLNFKNLFFCIKLFIRKKPLLIKTLKKEKTNDRSKHLRVFFDQISHQMALKMSN